MGAHSRYRNTNREIVRQIYETYFDDLYTYAKVITKSERLAGEAVSDVFYEILSSDRDLRKIRDPKVYLLRSIKNSAIRILGKDPVVFDDFSKEAHFKVIEKTDPEEVFIGKELDDILQKVFEQLPPHSRLAFNMVRIEGKSYQETSEMLGISVNTVRNHLVNITKGLRIELAKYYSENGVIQLIPNL